MSAWSWEKEPLTMTIVLIDYDKAMINQHQRGDTI